MYLLPRINGTPIDNMMTHKEYLSTQHRIVSLTGVFGLGDVDTCDILETMDAISDNPIKLIIASPGGLVDVALNINDTIRLLRSPVYTLGRFCASGAVLLLSVGTPGFRYVLPNSRVMLHSPSGGFEGKVEEVAVYARELTRSKEKLTEVLLANGARRTPQEVGRDMELDFWMNAKETIEYGLADHIMTPEIMQSWL